MTPKPSAFTRVRVINNLPGGDRWRGFTTGKTNATPVIGTNGAGWVLDIDGITITVPPPPNAPPETPTQLYADKVYFMTDTGKTIEEYPRLSYSDPRGVARRSREEFRTGADENE